jgi:LuxR family transcriptional regulator, maltose regulon positive regulatory protein
MSASGARFVEAPRASSSVTARARPPSPSRSDIAREALLRRIEMDPAPVTVVSGPAGSGKTSLLAAWGSRVTAAGGTVAWFGLESHDDSVGLLWAGILEALRATDRFGPDSRLASLVPPPYDVAPAFVDAIGEAVAALDGPLWLVLDDLHVLTDTAAIASLELLVRRLPPGLRLVLSGRTDPPVGLPRLRVEGRIRELRATDLAFTRDEVVQVVAQQELSLADRLITILHERTEGWAVGVRIAILALEQVGDAAELIERFQGDDREVADYLFTEVLSHLPAEGRRFLLATSVCRDLSVGLARELSGRDDAGEMLEALVRDGAFTRRVGRDRWNYRYHELFRSYLDAELRLTDPVAERELHIIAARWFEAQQEPLHAMEHVAHAGDLGRLVELGRDHGVGAILDGRGSELATILHRLGSAGRSEPWVVVLGATAALTGEDLDETERWLAGHDLERLSEDTDPLLAVLAKTLGVTRARQTTGIAQALAGLEASPACTTGHQDLDLLARYQRGVARLYVGRYADAYDDLELAADVARLTGRPAIEVSCLSFLSGTASSMGQYVAMRRQADRALEIGRELGWAQSQAVALAHCIAGWSAYLRADDAAGRQHAANALASLGTYADPDVELASRAVLAVVATRGDDPYEALRAFQRALERLLRAQMTPATLASAAPTLVRTCLDLGERELARSFARLAIERTPDPGEAALTRALLLDDAGKDHAARHQLDAIIDGRAPCHVAVSEVLALLFAAELERRRGNAGRAHDRLVRAIELGERHQLVQPFLERSSTRDLLAAADGRFGRHASFVQDVLARWQGTPEHTDHDGLRLTPAELDVLRDLPSLLTARDIADSRSVSVNTIKSHIKAIYRKLEVESRREAVEEARRRGLL